MNHQTRKLLLNWNSPIKSQYGIWKAELDSLDIEVELREGKRHKHAYAQSRLTPCEQCLLKHDELKSGKISEYTKNKEN